MKTSTRTVVTRTGAFLIACACTGALAACNHAAAAPPEVSPALEMPPPPPRDVEPLDAVDAEAPTPVPLPEEPAHRPPTSRVRPTRPEPAKPEAKPEIKAEPPKPAEAPPPVEAPKPPEEPPKPVTLQAQPATNEAEEERVIRGSLSKADSDLRRVNYRTLSVDAKAQYDYAKRYIHQAEDALTTRNLVFAKSVAQKAADIAAQLAGK